MSIEMRACVQIRLMRCVHMLRYPAPAHVCLLAFVPLVDRFSLRPHDWHMILSMFIKVHSPHMYAVIRGHNIERSMNLVSVALVMSSAS